MKKNQLVIMIGLIAISLVIVIWQGTPVGLEYTENTSLMIDLGKEFSIADIKKITSEVFPKQTVIIKPVEEYNEVVQITVKSVNEEQLEALTNKINETFELEKEVGDIVVTNHANYKIRDLVRPYVIPVITATLIILVYELIRFKKLGWKNVLLTSIMPIISLQVLLACAYEIFRFQINQITMIISMTLYISAAYYGIIALRNNTKEEPND